MNYLDIYELLNRSNCGKCGTPTCMAFALSVVRGEKDLEECSYIDRDTVERVREKIEKRDWKEELIDSLRKEVSGIDFESVAEGIGAELKDGKLRINCLGVDFLIEENGNIYSQGHINPWIKILLLHYIRRAGRSAPGGKWVSFGELKGGWVKKLSFTRDCEEPLRILIDGGINHFDDILSMFGGKHVPGQASDHAWIIYPLPKVPFLILYWRPDEDFGSNLRILFDSTADEYLDVESLIFLGEGLLEMFKRIILRHE
ncbi:corrinoid/iron-sulfur protein large subunit [bacterium BMS3Abin07]|nr:corrinoid/iron-sulfur protein large subunit [bacterium BMS3Abin07]GBE32530.1 corrinoid/iron-sulfur protein large subunit [bacterium BMS3Bbin05]HDO23433.1 DUF3786 domain-containing protein [Nitrospirota bacterium]HDZ88081.1 DUF3786 domain-containing protein [Nitrospirota bacterium]